MLEYGEPAAVIDAHWAALVSPWAARSSSRPRASAWVPSTTLRRRRASLLRADPAEPGAAAERFGGVYTLLVHKWYFDELYWAVFVRPCLAFARLCREIDAFLVDGLVNGSAA